jgi:uncharacterized membrane protein YidH (DUF202 family)
VARDPGLQPERTALAWQRTGLATLLVGSGAVAGAVHRGAPLVVVAALVALAVAALTAVPPRRHLGPPYARLLRATAATIALATVGVLLALT